MTPRAGPIHRLFPEAAALRRIFSHWPYLAAYPTAAVGVGLLYALLLPGLLLGGLQWSYLRFLTPAQLILAAGMGILLPLVFLLEVFLWRYPVCVFPRRAGKAGPLASILMSVVPGLLCCTAFIPAVLALFVSGTALLTLSPAIQYYLGTYAPILYSGSLLLVWASLRMAARRMDLGASQTRNSHPAPDADDAEVLFPRA